MTRDHARIPAFTNIWQEAILASTFMKTAGSARERRTTTVDGAKRAARTRRPVVFVSPSLTFSGAEKLGTRAEVRRPIRRGDLDRVESGALVAIVDGVIGDDAVTLREIRAAIARGVRLVGSAGIGAARAAKLPQMKGVGEIYRMYRSGELIGDDEVAVLLAEEHGHYLSVPLVNVRFAVGQLTRSGSLSPKHGDAIVTAAIAMPFRERTYENIVRAAGLSGKHDLDALVGALKAIDLKGEDAITLREWLEDLDSVADWNDGRGERSARDGAASERRARPDAPLRITEYGESLDFRTLLRFIALTGRLESYARNALFRYVVDGGKIPRPAMSRARSGSPQDLIEEISDSWGWTTSEELEITLRDLGFDAADLGERVNEWHRARVRLGSLLERMPSDLLRALRFELLTNDLALKREAMRLSALQRLAEQSVEPPTKEELAEAKKSLLATASRHCRAETWNDLVRAHRMRDADAAAIVRLVALARRRGVPLLEKLEHAPALPGTRAVGIADLPLAPFPEGGTRSMRDSDALAIAEQVGKTIGVKRVTQLATLEDVGNLHVAAAYGSTAWTSVASGKSETMEGATIGAIMEEAERCCQDAFRSGEVLTRAYEDWDPSEAVDPLDLYLPYDSPYRSDRPIEWTWATDLVSGRKIHVPVGALENRRKENDPYFSARLSRKWFSTNGLASGFTLSEALSHALCERIERHAYKLSEQEEGNPGGFSGPRPPIFHVDLQTCPPSTRRICETLKKSHYEVRVTDITCEVTVPTFYARVFRPSSGGDDEKLVDFYGPGCCTHPNAMVAINRAILEGVQSVLMNVDGAVDVAMNVRSLGRHERPRPNGIAELSRFQPWTSKRPFDANPGFVARDARDEVAFIVQRLTAASFDRVLYRDLSTEKTMPARVVRVLIPGMEDINPLYTGLRARVRAVSDLMRRHTW